MTFYAYLKAARDRCNITQAELAELTGVSVTTIQNWEKDTLPDKNYWQIIIDQLKLSKEDFVRYYTDTVLPCDKKNVQPFPDFLFPDDMIEKIKQMKLTAEEQELLGLEALYGDTCDAGNSRTKYATTKSGTLSKLPYEYVRRVGVYQIMNLNDSLADKIGPFRNCVVQQIKKNPDEIFDISLCSPQQMLELCECIPCIARDGHKTSWNNTVHDVLDGLAKIEDAGGSLVIATKDEDYWSFWHEYSYYLTFMDTNHHVRYEQYMKIVEKECKDVEYVKNKEKFEKDMSFYEEHASMMDHAPIKPKYKGTQNIEMTDRGKQLLSWYQANFRT